MSVVASLLPIMMGTSVLCSVPGVIVFISTATAREPNPNETIYESLPIACDDAEQSKQLLWPRMNVWMQQMCIISSFILIATDLSMSSCLNPSSILCYEDSWHLLVICFIDFIALFCDSSKKVSSENWKMRFLWVPTYTINTLYFITYLIQKYQYNSYNSLYLYSAVIFALFGMIFSILAVIHRKPIILNNPPTKEFTAGLFSYITFSYINKDLIDVGMSKESLELEDVPNLIDGDTCLSVYNVSIKTINNNTAFYI